MSEIRNAVIESAVITTENGFLDAWISLDYGGSGQGFGGYTLYLQASYSHHDVMSPAGHFIFRVMEIAGATKWSDLKGKTIRVQASHGGVEAIGHIIKDDWFCPAKDFADLEAGQ